VKLNCILRRLAIIPAILLLGAGCGGINASRSVSPLSFFLPGLVQSEPKAQSNPLDSPPPTPAATELAQVN
jgi:hypothetical protein